MADTTTTNSSTPSASDTVYLDTPEELSEADRLEFAALAGAGVVAGSAPVGRSATFPDGIKMPTVPNYPEGYKEKAPTPNLTALQSIARENELADTDGARASLEASVVKPGDRFATGRSARLPSWASPVWERAAYESDAAAAVAAGLESEQAALPARLNEAIDAFDHVAVQAVQARMTTIEAELFGARLEAQRLLSEFYDIGATEYTANCQIAAELIPEKKEAAAAAARELADVEGVQLECSIGAGDWRGYARRAKAGLDSLIFAEKKRLTQNAIKGPRQYR